MRIRSIKPGFWKSHSITALPLRTRLHFIGLWNFADDSGRGLDDFRLLKGEIWPLDDRVGPKLIGAMQVELARQGRIWRYTDGRRRYFEIVNWEEHQHPNKAQPSSYPAHDDPSVDPIDEPSVRTLFPDVSGSDPGGLPDDSRNGQVTRTSVVGSGSGSGVGVGKREEEIELATPSRRTRDPIFLTLCEVEGSNYDELDSAARKTVGVALARIHQASPDVTPEEIARRADIYREVMPPGTMLTAPALAKHWAKLARRPATQTGIRDRAAEILREAAHDAGR